MKLLHTPSCSASASVQYFNIFLGLNSSYLRKREDTLLQAASLSDFSSIYMGYPFR